MYLINSTVTIGSYPITLKSLANPKVSRDVALSVARYFSDYAVGRIFVYALCYVTLFWLTLESLVLRGNPRI